MLTLANDELAVELLDPASPGERAHLGARFCWGGYIWQVRDGRGGDLLAGPEWPAANPRPFNGQGLPESFRHAEWPSQRPLTLVDGHGLIVGAGEAAPGPDGATAITRPCAWEITGSGTRREFHTEQSVLGWSCRLVRAVALGGRTLTSASRLTNTGRKPLPLHWFAHPFFALGEGVLTCDLPAGYGFDENPGFALDARSRLSFKRRFIGVDDGHFQLLHVAPRTPLRATLSHPRLEFVRFSTDFVPGLCPVWGNGNTWSIEPYLMTTLEPGETRSWELRYEFGPRK
jgi:hypothetical protein